MNIELDEELIRFVRRLNAKINGTLGGASRSKKKVRAARKSIKKAVRVRLQAA